MEIFYRKSKNSIKPTLNSQLSSLVNNILNKANVFVQGASGATPKSYPSQKHSPCSDRYGDYSPSLLSIITSNCQGQLLVESMVAITIIITGLFGVLALLANSLGLNKVVSDQYVGTYLASEGIEIIRNLIDSELKNNPISGKITVFTTLPDRCKSSKTGCIVSYKDDDILSDVIPAIVGSTVRFHSSPPFYDHDISAPPTPFKRVVFVDNDPADPSNILRIRSTVNWTGRGGGEFRAELVDRFYNKF